MAASNTRTRKRSSRSTAKAANKGLRLDGKAVALGTLSLGAIAAAIGAVLLGRRRGAGDGSFGSGEHPPIDLMGDEHPGLDDRAPEAFRPDPTAPVPEGERDALRPALAGAAAPRLVAGQAREHERTDAAPS